MYLGLNVKAFSKRGFLPPPPPPPHELIYSLQINGNIYNKPVHVY